MGAFGALCLCRGSAIPGLFAAKNVVNLLFGKVGDFAFDAGNDTVDVGASAALEAQVCAVLVGAGLVGDKAVGALFERER